MNFCLGFFMLRADVPCVFAQIQIDREGEELAQQGGHKPLFQFEKLVRNF